MSGTWLTNHDCTAKNGCNILTFSVSNAERRRRPALPRHRDYLYIFRVSCLSRMLEKHTTTLSTTTRSIHPVADNHLKYALWTVSIKRYKVWKDKDLKLKQMYRTAFSICEIKNKYSQLEIKKMCLREFQCL